MHFFDWVPNCEEGNLQFNIPTWFVVNSLPPELNHISILKRIGRKLGNLIGLDVAFESSNNIRFLISCQTNSSHSKTIKLITNRSIYDLKFLKYEGRIADIIRMDDEKRYSFNMDIKSSDLSRSLPLIQSRKLKRNHDWHKSEECSKGQNMVIAEEKM